jgi:hypothetical protein
LSAVSVSKQLEEFTKSLSSYFDGLRINKTSLREEFNEVELMSSSEIDSLTKDGCFNAAYVLYQYADFISIELNKLRAIFYWCENSLNEIVSREINDLPQFNKYEIKVAEVLRSNVVAKNLQDWKIKAQSRINMLESKEQNIRRRAECLIEKGKRK